MTASLANQEEPVEILLAGKTVRRGVEQDD